MFSVAGASINSSFNNNIIHWVIGSVGAANVLVIDYCLGAGSNEKETRLPCSRPEDLPFHVFLFPLVWYEYEVLNGNNNNRTNNIIVSILKSDVFFPSLQHRSFQRVNNIENVIVE